MKCKDLAPDDKLRTFNAYRKKKHNLDGFSLVHSEDSGLYSIYAEGFINSECGPYESKEEAFEAIWCRFSKFYPSFEEMELFNAISGEES